MTELSGLQAKVQAYAALARAYEGHLDAARLLLAAHTPEQLDELSDALDKLVALVDEMSREVA